jgi:tRNA G18 (ribose-2'-O)-methylase SpoU
MADVIVVDDPEDERFRQFRLNERGLASRIQKRDDTGAGLFLAEGDLVVERGLDAGCVPIAALVDVDHVPPVAERLDCPIYGGGAEVRRVVSQLGMPLSIVALFARPRRPSVRDLARRCRRLVIVEAVDNPANVGSIVRNAAGLGWDGLVLDHTSADPFSRRALRVAMGTAFSIPHARTRELADEVARLDGFDVYALTPEATATPIGEVEPGERAAIVLGSERAGISAQILEIATPVRIPMASGVDSLNVAAATAIACWTLGPG